MVVYMVYVNSFMGYSQNWGSLEFCLLSDSQEKKSDKV